MMENDPRTEEQADADWRRVTESLFGTNTRDEPKVDGGDGIRGKELCAQLGK